MITWNFNEKVGEAIIYNYDKDYTYNLYKGNAFLIFLDEYKENGKNMYVLHNFFVDKIHAKRMLGIDMGWIDTYGDNLFNTESYKLKKIRINKEMYGLKDTKMLIDMLIEAFDEIKIEIY